MVSGQTPVQSACCPDCNSCDVLCGSAGCLQWISLLGRYCMHCGMVVIFGAVVIAILPFSGQHLMKIHSAVSKCSEAKGITMIGTNIAAFSAESVSFVWLCK